MTFSLGAAMALRITATSLEYLDNQQQELSGFRQHLHST